MTAFVLTSAGVFGLIVGSFLNVVVYRLPRRESLVWPGSHCTACGSKIHWYDNLPLVSYLALRGRCRNCRQRISLRYPLLELLTGLVVAGVAWRFVGGPGLPEWGRFAVGAVLAGVLLAVSFIDIEHRIIPDRITKPGMILAPFACMLVPTMQQTQWLPQVSPSLAALLLSLAGMATGAGSIWLMGEMGRLLFRKDAMGLGDVKLMALVGALLGPVGVLLAVLIACFGGSIIGILVFLVTRSSYIPFGPFLSLGTLLVFCLRERIVDFILALYR